ncbi:secreted protein [Melampsora americana]|nr:secreted protein [Melampsora americana]
MVFNKLLFIFMNLVIIEKSFGQTPGTSNEDCSVFWGPSVAKPGKFLCLTSDRRGKKSYYCDPPSNKAELKVNLGGCVPYPKSPSGLPTLDNEQTRAPRSNQMCDAARRRANVYINCGMVQIVNGVAKVTDTFRCQDYKSPPKKATGCVPINKQIDYDVNYKFIE